MAPVFLRAQNINTCSGSTGGVNFAGSFNAYTQPVNCTGGDFRVLNYRRISVNAGNPVDGRGQWKTTVNVQTVGGNMAPVNMAGGVGNGFLFTNGGNCASTGSVARKWAFGVTAQGNIDAVNSSNYFTAGGIDMGLNMSTAGFYTFVLQDAGCVNTNYYVGRTTNNPVAISHTGAAQRAVNNDGSVTVTFTLNAIPSVQENFFIRYRGNTNDFSTGTSLVQAVIAGTTGTATIPVQVGANNVNYYIFSSTRTLAQLNAHTESDRSLAALNFTDNAGANFTYASAILVNGTTPPTSALYATFSVSPGAFSAINGGIHQGVITATVLGDVTTETGNISLLAGGVLPANYMNITINPAGNRLVQGASATQLLDINGADNVTVDGLNTGGNSLIIDNTNAAASNGTIRFINDAQNNTIRNCTLKGSSTATNAGVIFFSSAAATNGGNDNITIQNNIIRESSNGDPVFGIVSFGSSGSPTSKWNSNNTVSGNEFINCFNSGASINGCIHLTNAANENWTISGNSFYWTNTKTTVASFDYWYGIRITGSNGTGFSILNNYIGGTAPLCGGTAMTISNTSSGNKIVGIDLAVSTLPGSANVQGNTIANIFLGTNSSKSTMPYVFSGIAIEAGTANVGTTTSNTIGSMTSAGSISVSLVTNAGGIMTGIASATSSTIANNNIGGLSASNPVPVAARLGICGILGSANALIATGNTIGSAAVANSILNTTGSTSMVGGLTSGISQSAGTQSQIRNNTISNLTYSGGSTTHRLIGIDIGAGITRITSNTVKNLNSSAPNFSSGAGTSVMGIYRSTGGGLPDSVSQNTVFNLQNSNPGAMGYSVIGIELDMGANVQTHIVNANLVYDLKVSSTSITSVIDGIRFFCQNAVASNNMICLGSSLTNNPQVNGINVQSGAIDIYFNSIAITGSATGSAANTNGITFVNASTGSEYVNNILYNTRTSATPAKNSAVFFNGGTQFNNVTTGNYNDLYVSAGNSIAAVSAATYATLAAWQVSAKDINSISILPQFVNVVNDLHISGGCDLTQRGTAISITADFDLQTRGNPPDIGADEFSATVTGVTWTGAVNTNWHVPGNWCPAVVPTSSIDAIIPNTAVSNQPLIDLGGNAVCKNLTIGTGKILSMASSRLLQVYGSSFTNNGTFSSGSVSETVEFTGMATINGSSATIFNNCIINNTTTLTAGVIPTMIGVFTLNSGSSVNTAPVYGASSRLNYNTGGTYNVSVEWVGTTITAGPGNPNDVSLSNNTVLNMPAVQRGMAGTMYITSGTLQMNGAAGADLYVGRDWQRTSVTGVFNPNSRTIWFKGATDQVVRVMGNGTETFHYLVIDKPLAGTFLKPSNAAGSLTNITVNATVGDVFQIINSGSLDINGRTFTLDNNNSVAAAGNIYVTGARTITNTDPGGINAGSFAIRGTNNINQPAYFTKTVRNNAGTGSLTFNQNVLVTIADGKMDFGFDGVTNITTVQGVLQVNLGGSVFPNSCFYSGPAPASVLRFANAADYQVNATDKTWAAGAIYSGIAGIPYNVEVINTNTDLIINNVRALRNDLTITDGRLTLLAGPFTLGGNWTRTNPAGITVPPCAFMPNTNRVIFDKTGAGNQVITCSVNSNTETYYALEISPATVNVHLAGGTNVNVNNELLLTTGKIDLNTNMLTLGTLGFAGTLTGGSTSSYIIGYKAAVNGIFKRFVPSTGSYLFPLGDNTNYTPYNLNLTAGTFSNSSINSSLYDLPHPNLGSATSYISRYWKMEPSGITNPFFNTTYMYVDADVVGTESSLYPFRFSSAWMGSGGSGAAFIQGTGSVNTGTNILTWNSMNSFGDFTGLGNGTPLPITLLNFSASLKENDGVITWTTANEINNDFFTLERSWDAKNFEPVNKQPGAGTSSSALSYFYTDKNVGASGHKIAYYRLKQTDFNGAFTLSKIVPLALNSGRGVAVIGYYPNPFQSSFTVALNADDNYTTHFTLYNKQGKLVYDKSILLTKGSNHVMIDAAVGSASGIYTLRITSDEFISHIKVSKQ